MNKIKQFNEELDMLTSRNRFELSFNEAQIAMQIRSKCYMWVKNDTIRNKEGSYEQGSSTHLSINTIKKKDVKCICKMIRHYFKDLRMIQCEKNVRQGIIESLFVGMEFPYPYEYTITTITKMEDCGILTTAEIPTVIRAVTYFLDNIKSWEGYHGMSMTMSLDDPYNFKLEKYAYLP